MQVPTTDQLRDRIDKGLTGEKVPVSDPAAAPLGTDDEAAGAPPTLQERAMAAEHSPGPLRPSRPSSGPLIYLLLALCLGTVILGIAFLASQR